jgi:hypothetical protein
MARCAISCFAHASGRHFFCLFSRRSQFFFVVARERQRDFGLFANVGGQASLQCAESHHQRTFADARASIDASR